MGDVFEQAPPVPRREQVDQAAHEGAQRVIQRKGQPGQQA
jgi:hypothetical protein